MSAIRRWTIGAVAACLAVLALGWFLLVSPERSKATDLHTQAVDVQTAITKLTNQLSILKAQAQDLPAQEALLSRLSAQMPPDPALPSLIRGLSAEADKAGVDLVSIAPATPQLVTAATTPVKAAESTDPKAPTAAPVARPKVVGSSNLAMVPLALTVTGGYFQIEQFVSALEAQTRVFLTTGFAIAPSTTSRVTTAAAAGGPSGAAAGSSSRSGDLQVTLSGRVFMNPKDTSSSPTTASAVAAK